MRREHRYTVTHTSHLDFGAGAQDIIAHLQVVPDGSGWAKRSPNLTLKIGPDELAIGDTIRLTIEREAA